MTTNPEPSLCDNCIYAVKIHGGYAEIGGSSCEQRYCSVFKKAIHFGGVSHCEKFYEKEAA